jgi:hypothetical protein
MIGRQRKFICFTHFDGQCPGRAAADACTEAVAVTVFDKFGFAVYDSQRAFFTVYNAKTAAVAFFFINFDNLSDSHKSDPFLCAAFCFVAVV